ncbi:MAG: thiolase family protein, partial [Nitrospinota bacterium]|nr:thiolase family protein [Nitrospinota bacterium]
MGDAVAIIGAGQTDHKSRRLDVNAPELIDEAVQRALNDADMGPDGVDAIVVGNMEHFEGIHLSDLWSVEGTGGIGKPHLKVATGGTTGSSLAQAAFYLVSSGMFRTVMAAGWERLSDSEGETTTGIVTAFD